jgi:hypothetical protein
MVLSIFLLRLVDAAIDQVLKFFFLAGTKRDGIVEEKTYHPWNTDHHINTSKSKDIPS